MHIGELLKTPGRLHTLRSDRTVEDAIDEMAARQATALIVMDGDTPVGIFAERDVLRCYLRHRPQRFADIPVTGAMTNKLIVAEPQEPISAALAMMVKADIKHLPVVDGGRIVGVVTISELVKHQIGSLTAELHDLKDYIADLHDAGQD